MSDSTDTIPPGDEDRVLAAEYVLGLLSQKDTAAFEARLTDDPDLRALTAAWADDLVAMTDDISAENVPRRVWLALEEALFDRSESTVIPLTPRRRSLGGALAGMAAAAVLVVSLLMTSDLLVPQQPGFQAEIGTASTAAHFSAAYDPATRELALDRIGPDAAPGRSYELWLIAGDAAPVSVVVWPDGAERQVVALPQEMAQVLPGAILAVSDEPLGGSPTGAPTGAVLATGQVTES